MDRISKVNVDHFELQKELASSIDQVRYQFSLISSKIEEENFLQSHFYIAKMAREVEELLVEAGLLLPHETKNKQLVAEEPMEKRIDKATQIFYDLVSDYYPELISPDMQKLRKATEE